MCMYVCVKLILKSKRKINEKNQDRGYLWKYKCFLNLVVDTGIIKIIFLYLIYI